MASLSRDGDSWRICFALEDPNDRKRIRLSELTKAQADEARQHVGKLVQAKLSNVTPADPELRWLADIGDDLHGKLAAHGLVTARGQENRPKLKQFLARYFETLPVKKSTAITYHQTEGNLLEYFGAAADLRSIDAAGADAWRAWLAKQQKLAQATVARRVKHARQMFKRCSSGS